MTPTPDGWLPPGVVDALIEAGKYAGGLTVFGGVVAWGWSRVEALLARRKADRRETDQQRAERDRAEDERQLEERRFLDERAQRDMARLEAERDQARAECRKAEKELSWAREGWVLCLHEARRCQQLIVAMHLRPPERGSDPPDFEPLPDPRRDGAGDAATPPQ